MIVEGACDDPVPTMAFGFHVTPYPKGYIGYRPGNQFGASCLIKITITGLQVHGSTPWMGIDTMPAVGAVLTGIELPFSVSGLDHDGETFWCGDYSSGTLRVIRKDSRG